MVTPAHRRGTGQVRLFPRLDTRRRTHSYPSAGATPEPDTWLPGELPQNDHGHSWPLTKWQSFSEPLRTPYPARKFRRDPHWGSCTRGRRPAWVTGGGVGASHAAGGWQAGRLPGRRFGGSSNGATVTTQPSNPTSGCTPESGTRVHVNTCAQVHDGSTHGSRKGDTAQRPTDRRADRESGPGPAARGPGPPRATRAGRAAKTRRGRGSGARAGTAQRRAPQGECAEAESGSAASGGGGWGRVLKSRVPPGL